MQVFDQLKCMGSLYQQFYHWGADLQEKALKAEAAGDPTATKTLVLIASTAEACKKGVAVHAVPLYAAPLCQ
jgi:hypothetical protein